MNSSTMHHVAAARMEARLAAAEASRMAKDARRARTAQAGVEAHHPIDWVRQLTAAVTHALAGLRHAGATGH